MDKVGKYRNRIIIQMAELTSNGYGGYSKTYSTRATIWASVIPLSGNEAVRYKQVYPTVQYKITLRYRADITTDCRIYYRGLYHNIKNIINVDNRDAELILLTEVTPGEQV